ncbi:hypothetical protein C2E21_2813 [Chlorella sorokiniana]|uniref:Uncharacterized protein n=1 Tax=Chlorella sorokiniana TaxID=3076 RepID=A0A2P6TVQ2_CHLSO|nr:hypothetical protein C2E21_2813 [Chlorella sorokiniana]|eukprot:PRW58136.1 hypothetical protein C2E21_2813 [Chlorella sorokiniana]
MAVLEEERAAAAAKSSRAKASREAQRTRREQQLVKALQKAGMAGIKSRSHSRATRRRLKAFIKKGQGSVQELVQSAKQESEVEAGRIKRRQELYARLHAEGLDGERWSAAAQAYIASDAGRQTLDQAVTAIKAARQEVTDREARRTRITELFTQQGLAEFLPQQNAWGGWAGGYYGGQTSVAGLMDYVRTGAGSEEAVLAAAQAVVAERQARQARRTRLTELLAAEGLEQYVVAGNRYIHDGTGSEEAALAAARTLAEEAAARAARRTRLTELLTAEGLLQHRYLCDDYIVLGEGSEEAALEKARQAGQRAAARQARRDALTAALQAEGIPFGGQMESALYGFLNHGTGGQEQAMETARRTHQTVQERVQRREQLTALMAAEGLSLVDWEWRLPGLHSYLHTGSGNKTAEEFVAQARAMGVPGQGAAPLANAYAV